MAIEIKTIPVLHGEAAARFVEAADEALEKRGSIDFSKQVAKLPATSWASTTRPCTRG